jgi:hypothetical protein
MPSFAGIINVQTSDKSKSSYGAEEYFNEHDYYVVLKSKKKPGIYVCKLS